VATSSKRIAVERPVAELDGDEMTRVIWAWIKDKASASLLPLNTLKLCR
jgi:isocitrate dehydrogenase